MKKKGMDARLGQHRSKNGYEQAEHEGKREEEEDGGVGEVSLHPCRRSRKR